MLDIGCIRFYNGRIRWHTLRQKLFLRLLKNFVRIRTYGLYDKHILGIHAEYARGSPDIRYSHAGISKDICAYQNYFINFHTLLIRFTHTQWCDRAVTS